MTKVTASSWLSVLSDASQSQRRTRSSYDRKMPAGAKKNAKQMACKFALLFQMLVLTAMAVATRADFEDQQRMKRHAWPQVSMKFS